MDNDDEITACAAAYCVLLCGEFLKSRAAFISKNGLRGRTQSFVSAPMANAHGRARINPAPHLRYAQARQTLSSPHTRGIAGSKTNSTAQLLQGVRKSAPPKHRALKHPHRFNAAAEAAKKIKAKGRPRTAWMRPLYKSRFKNSARDLLSDLKEPSGGKLENFCHMSFSDFEMILSRISPLIGKQTTIMRECIPAHERLAVALRFLATGESFSSLTSFCKFSRVSVSTCVYDVCGALIEVFQDEIKLPTTKDHWQKIAEQYEKRWNFPNCLGAIGGKHMLVCSPRSQGNDKDLDTSVLVLLALVDADYCFTFVDIGCQDRMRNGSAKKKPSFITKFQMDQVDLPLDSPLPSSSIPVPYVFLGDSVFALTQHTMTPYTGVFEERSSQRIFNYRLTRARRVIENVFGTMMSVFGVLRKQMMLEPEKVINITKACVLLHNVLRKSKLSSYPPPGTFDTEDNGVINPGSWRSIDKEITSFLDIKKEATSNPEEIAKAIRNSFAEYFTASGKLPWQDECC